MSLRSPAELEELRETLVAYLDRELDTEARRRIEEQLAADEQMRDELQRLQRVSDALEALPRSNVDDSFTRTTIEMVAVAAEEDLLTETRALPVRRRRRWLWGAGGLLAAGLLGFLGALWLAPDPNAPLLRNLELIENMDLYTEIGDLDYLRGLEKSGLFDEPTEPDQARG
jgi:anti-sigma factor RsiW